MCFSQCWFSRRRTCRHEVTTSNYFSYVPGSVSILMKTSYHMLSWNFVLSCLITLKFGGRLDKYAAEMPIKFWSDWEIFRSKSSAFKALFDLRAGISIGYWDEPLAFLLLMKFQQNLKLNKFKNIGFHISLITKKKHFGHSKAALLLMDVRNLLIKELNFFKI